MKTSAILNYGIEDVFYIFVRAAKKDFSTFNEENPKGCKITRKINSYLGQVIECTVEITDYVKNEKYEITTSSQNSKCVSTYTFKKSKNNSTLLEFKEVQSSGSFILQLGMMTQRFLGKSNVKEKYNVFIESLENELKTYSNNIERSKSKKDSIKNI